MDANITIRRAVPDDAAEIRKVLRETWLATYPSDEHGISMNDIKSRFGDEEEQKRLEKTKKHLQANAHHDVTLVAMENSIVIGVCHVQQHEGRNEQRAFYVLPEYQGKGVGKALWQEAQKYLNPAYDTFVDVAKHNNKAIRFYEKLGFHETAEKVDHFPLAAGKTMPLMRMIRKT